MTPFEAAFRATLVLLLAFAAVAGPLRRSSAARRHLVWLLALGALLVLPVLKPLGRLSLPAAWPQAAPIAAAGPARTVIEVTAEAAPAPDRLWWIWAAGALAVLAKALAGQRAAGRLAAGARSTAEPDVRLSPDAAVPMVCGLLRPVIVLPEEATQWPAGRRAAALAHERQHIRRGDTWSQALAWLVCALYWPHPLVWVAAAALRRECEQAADDGVLVHQGTPASDYAGHLLEIARGLAQPRRTAPAGGIAMTRTTQLPRRIAALLDPQTDRRPGGHRFSRFAAAVALAAAAGAAILPLPVLAQAPGTLAGVVRDPSGAVVPKVRVDLTAPGVREVVYTSAAGEFSFTGVSDGAYDLTVFAPGFARMTQSGIRHDAASPKRLELTLQLGAISERVTVEAPGTPAPAAATGGPPQRIRVGGNVQSAKLIERVRPEYPVSAKIDGVMGTVLLNAVVGRDGTVVSLEPINKQVDPRLVESAMRAVRQWRYSTTLLNGNPVEVTTVVEVNYTLAP